MAPDQRRKTRFARGFPWLANGARLILNNTAAFVKSWNLFWSTTSTSKPAHPRYVDLAAARSKPLKKNSMWSWNKSRSFGENLCRLVGRISLTLWSECRKPVLRQKLTKNLARAGCLYRLRKTIAKKILQKAFNSCPTTTVCCESSQLQTLTVLSGDNEKKSPRENKQSIVGAESASNLN